MYGRSAGGSFGLCFQVHLTELTFIETSDLNFRWFVSSLPGERARLRVCSGGKGRCFTCADIFIFDPICVWWRSRTHHTNDALPTNVNVMSFSSLFLVPSSLATSKVQVLEVDWRALRLIVFSTAWVYFCKSRRSSVNSLSLWVIYVLRGRCVPPLVSLSIVK